MNKNKFYLSCIVALIISNIVLVGFMLMGGPPPPHGPKHIIIQKLNFDEAQIKDYERLIKKHKNDIDAKLEEFKLAKKDLYNQLLETENSTKNAALLAKIGAVQVEMEAIHYDHFLAIKTLCKPAQKNNFEVLVGELTKLFSHEPPEK